MSVESLALSQQAGIARSLEPFVQRHELAGAVTLAVSKDKVLSLEAVGYSDVQAGKPMRTDALFWIASLSKPIAATALMLLVDERKVRLDDPVETYLPDFAPPIIALAADGIRPQLVKSRHAITVRNLLTHTSGLPFSSSLEIPTLDLLPLAVRVRSYALQPLTFEPGAVAVYSNAGINTAARIVEIVSAMAYEDFLQKRVFEPLGMIDTTFWPTESQARRLAKSYMPGNSGTGLQEVPITQLRYPLTDRAHRYAMPAGGLFSTASDLGWFCQMLLNGGIAGGRRYLSEDAIREMTRDQLSATAKAPIVWMWHGGYGLGWETDANGVFGHKGVYSMNMGIDPPHDIATVWLVQHAGFPGEGSKSYVAFYEAVSKRFKSAPVPP